MRVIRKAHEIRPNQRPISLGIGVFDGVHLGHQQVIRQAVADAGSHEGLAVGITFDRHPNAVVAPSHTPPLIYSLPQKLRAMGSLGLDFVWLIEFDRSFSQQPAETFIRDLARDFGPICSICVGSQFTFGHRRQGDVTLLRSLGRELHFTVHGLASVSLDGDVVSSTRIRECVRAGDLDRASQMLGRAYALSGPVITGDGRGRTLGVPTANLDAGGLVLPPNGVYTARASIDGAVHRAVMNIGFRPTVQQGEPVARAEVHLLDFDCDLYGREMEVTPVFRLRDERSFPSLEALKAQIQDDIREARQRFEA